MKNLLIDQVNDVKLEDKNNFRKNGISNIVIARDGTIRALAMTRK